MNEYESGTKYHRLYSVLIRLGFIILGGIVGILIGAFLYTYFIPFWHHTKIDVENHNFSEIVLVDYGYLENVHLSQDNVILKADDGTYYSYHQNNLQRTESPTIDKTKFPHNSPPCSEWFGPPPGVYLRRVKNSVGVEFGHALAVSSRCYILQADGSLHLWARDYGVFEMMFMGASSLIIGVVVGAVTGSYVAKRKYV
jgi:hypothetical protein